MNINWRSGSREICFQNRTLILKSSGLSRDIDFSAGYPRTLRVKSGDDVLAVANQQPDVRIAGLYPFAEFTKPGMQPEIISCCIKEMPESDRDAVYLEMICFEKFRRIEILYRYILYDTIPAIGIEIELISGVTPLVYRGCRHYEKFNKIRDFSCCSIMDTLTLPESKPCKSLEFRMRTDYHNDLLVENCDRSDGLYGVNIFTGGQVIWLQEAPPSEERMEIFEADFLVTENVISSCGSGFTAFDIIPGQRMKSCRHTLLIGRDCGEACRKYLQRRGYGQNNSAGKVTVNPWGGGNFNTLVNEEFLLREISAAAECRADIYQIDDGFQSGGNLGDLSALNRYITPEYWQFASDRFPEGPDKVVWHAQKNGIKLSLWFAPGCNREFDDESLTVLLNWQKRYGINIFKLDGVVLDSCRAHDNFRKLLESLKSSGITVNLDVTNGLRGGVCEFGEFGPVFLENRYVNQTWVDVPYDPEATLKNLWQLSKYIPAGNIQIEVPSPQDIIEDFFGQNGRPPRPDRYDFKFWLAAAMPALPLLWFQPSKQSTKIRHDCREMMKIYRECQRLISGGDIVPVGAVPGCGITGFIGNGRICFAYRTLKADGEANIFPHHYDSRLIYSSSTSELHPDGRVILSEPGSFAIWEIKVDKKDEIL